MDAPTQTRWFHLTPGRFVIGLLAVEGLLWLSDRFGWLAWHKGYAVLTGIASVGVAMLAMVVWFAMALIFRWRFQFSIRSLLVLGVVVAVPFGWLAVERQRKRDHREAVRSILGSGGFVTYAFENTPPPIWVVKLLGVELFADLIEIDYSGKPVSNGELQYLKQLDWFGRLSLSDSHISDASLEQIQGSTHIYSLELARTSITDTGLKHLEGLTRLEHLNLDGTTIGDVGLQHIEGLTQLSELYLAGTKVTSAGVAKLRKALPNCKICQSMKSRRSLIVCH